MFPHHPIQHFVRLTLFSTAAMVFAACGSSDDDSNGGTYCCMLRDLGSHCATSNSTSSLNANASLWSKTGNSGNAEACKAMIESDDLGCTGSSSGYGSSSTPGRTEVEAAAACAY